MKHLVYPSITNHYQGKFIDKVKLEFPKEINEPNWTVTEKLHGSNYSFWVDYYTSGSGYVRSAKRTDFIGEKEEFYNHQEVFGRLNRRIFKLAKKLTIDIVVFGELFGGNYDNVSKGKLVQRGVQYSPYNEFLCFDIARYKNGINETLEFFSHQETLELCKEFNIPHVPVLFTGTLDQCLNFNNNFTTTIPKLYDLQDVENNICEGVVIKPNKPLFLKSGDRVIIKNKNEKFKEINHVRKSKIVPTVFSNDILSVISLIHSGLTDNRMDNIVSIHGDELEFSEAMKLLLIDAINDTCEVEYSKLDKDEKHVVNKYLNKDLASIVRRKIVLKKKHG